MMINKVNHSVDYNWGLKSMDKHPYEPTNQNLIKVPKVVRPKNKKKKIHFWD